MTADVQKTLWVKDSATNLLDPAAAGAKSAVASSSAISFLEGKEQAAAVAQLYRETGTRLSPQCDLAKHIAAAAEVCDQWLSGKDRKIPVGSLFRGIQMDKIATSVLATKASPNVGDYLRLLASGSLDVMSRRPSRAKDTLWELELYALLRTRSVIADLDEPDIVAKVGNTVVGVACKRIYSHNNVAKTLSVAVAQIENVSEYGLLAINIDDLWPANQLRAASSDEMLGHSLSQENLAFLARHDRHLRKYLSSGRVMGAMVASGGIAYVERSYRSARQFTTWTMPGLEPAKAKLISGLQKQIQARW